MHERKQSYERIAIFGRWKVAKLESFVRSIFTEIVLILPCNSYLVEIRLNKLKLS